MKKIRKIPIVSFNSMFHKYTKVNSMLLSIYGKILKKNKVIINNNIWRGKKYLNILEIFIF